MLSEDGLFLEEILLYADVNDFEEREDQLTPREMFELTQLHEEAMIPTQEEEDWMMFVEIKKEVKILAHLYWPDQSQYKIEDICDICKRLFYKKGSILAHMETVHSEGVITQKTNVIPQESWLAKSLPNLKELLETIPVNTLVSEEDELELKQDFQDIMYKVRYVKHKSQESVKPPLKCSKCKFNSTSKDSLKTHNKNIHEQVIFKCDQCPVCTLSKHILKKHISQSHNQKRSSTVNQSLNFIKGKAGGLPNLESNDKRGQASTKFKLVNKVDKRDIKSMQPGLTLGIITRKLKK